MRRSLLFIPGNNPAMLQNADVFEGDAVILDLEDAVSITEKDSARNLVYQYLETYSNACPEIVIRINGFDTPYFNDDLNKIVSDKIDTIMFPKARVKDLKKLDQLLSKIESKKKMSKKIGVIPIIELAISVLEIEEIACLKRVNGMLLGGEDLTSDLEIVRTKEADELSYPRARIAFACRAYQIDAIDTPFADTIDLEGLRKDSQKAQNLGMNARVAIHPNQIEVINEVFSPSKELIEWAKKVLKASEIAEQKGIGVFSLDGKMIDKPIIVRAEKIIKKAKKFNVL